MLCSKPHYQIVFQLKAILFKILPIFARGRGRASRGIAPRVAPLAALLPSLCTRLSLVCAKDCLVSAHDCRVSAQHSLMSAQDSLVCVRPFLPRVERSKWNGQIPARGRGRASRGIAPLAALSPSVCTRPSCVCARLSCVCTTQSYACTRQSCVCTPQSFGCTRLSCVCIRLSCVCTRESHAWTDTCSRVRARFSRHRSSRRSTCCATTKSTCGREDALTNL